MLIKAGVDISRLNREIRRALYLISMVAKNRQDEIVITSTYEGNHNPGSLHYANDAFDMRIPSWPGVDSYSAIKEALGDDYDVVLEPDHIHIEYDPKK